MKAGWFRLAAVLLCGLPALAAGDSTPALPDAPSAAVPPKTLPKAAEPTHVTGRMLTIQAPVSGRTCEAGLVPARECGEHWKPLLTQSLTFLLLQHGGRLAIDGNARHDLVNGKWFDEWRQSVEGNSITRWNDGDPFVYDYIGHPLMGAVTDFLYIQNDPRGRDLTLTNTRAYWTSRLRAMAFSAVYSAQWEVGPLSEASLENTGRVSYYSTRSHGMTNGTGMVDFVMTPVGGTAWAVTEDLIDRQIIWRLEGHTNNKFALAAMSALNPGRSVANLLRRKAPWYRDSRFTRRAHLDLPFQNVGQ